MPKVRAIGACTGHFRYRVPPASRHCVIRARVIRREAALIAHACGMQSIIKVSCIVGFIQIGGQIRDPRWRKPLGKTIERCIAWNLATHLALALASCLQCVVGAVAKSAV